TLYVNRSVTHLKKKNHAEALQDAEMGLRLAPDNPEYMGQIAWILASADDDRIRNPKKALEMAQKACASASWSPNILDTLACAHAANGGFDEALRWVRKAVHLAGSLPVELQKEIQEHEEMFRRGEVVRK